MEPKSRENSGKEDQNRLFAMTNWILLAAGIVNILVGCLFAIKGEATKSTSFTAIALLLFLAATIDRFESLKGLGIEAKTKKLDKKIEQADEVLNQLKNLAEVTGASLVSITSKVGRWGTGISTREAYALAQKVRRILLSIGSENTTIEEALKPWARISCFDLARVITSPICNTCNEELRHLHQANQSKSPINPHDEKFMKYIEESRLISEYQQKLSNLHLIKLEEYPDALFALINEAPIQNREVISAAANKASHFAPMIIELKKNFYLTNPEPWFVELETPRQE
ncbi:hypothetical protein [Geothrix terrae]|uniref:hypothetical protein n=1 Tax=Geothrix terrae TaxID=2922720 RepID=UPI001FAD5039|nr:hypothetical protein [Geothrix terrae]